MNYKTMAASAGAGYGIPKLLSMLLSMLFGPVNDGVIAGSSALVQKGVEIFCLGKDKHGALLLIILFGACVGWGWNTERGGRAKTSFDRFLKTVTARESAVGSDDSLAAREFAALVAKLTEDDLVQLVAVLSAAHAQMHRGA